MAGDAVLIAPVSSQNSLLTGNFAIFQVAPLNPEATVPQRLLAQFPTRTNRQNILKNREFSSENRELCSYAIKYSTPQGTLASLGSDGGLRPPEERDPAGHLRAHFIISVCLDRSNLENADRGPKPANSDPHLMHPIRHPRQRRWLVRSNVNVAQRAPKVFSMSSNSLVSWIRSAWRHHHAAVDADALPSDIAR
jgi:hypothetical protein